MQLIFGIGALWGTRTDVANIGPNQFAILQDNMIDFSFELKELYSQLQFPVDIARGKGKITGKAKMAQVYAALYADLFFGAGVTQNLETNTAEGEQHTVPATGPYTFGVSNLTSFVSDLGVTYATGSNVGNPLQFTSGTVAPTQRGFYSLASSGVYNFNSLDASALVAVSYTYTDNNGKTITLTSQFMGYTPTFSATFYQQRNTQGSTGQLTLLLTQCVSSHLSFPSRIDDYGIPDFDFMAFANSAGSIGSLSTSQ